MPNESEQIELRRSEEVQEILGTPPRWIVRWGTMVIFLTISGLVGLSWLVQYPDIVPGVINITTAFPPAAVKPINSGKIVKIYVNNEDTVLQDQHLILIENTANEKDIFELEQDLEKLKTLSARHVVRFRPDKRLDLGKGVQESYSDFIRKFEDYKYLVRSNYDDRKSRKLQRQIDKIEEMNEVLRGQKKSLNREIVLLKKDYERDSSQLKVGTVSEKNYERTKSAYIRSLRERQNIDYNIVNNELQITEIEKQIFDVTEDFKATDTNKYIALEESIKQLLEQIAVWKKSFIITAPFGGVVSMRDRVELGQFADNQTPVLTIVPISNKTIGRAKIKSAGSGKIEEGQDVNVKLASFPFMEYGSISGKVTYISLVPNKDYVDVEISLPDTLVTTHKRIIPFQQEMEGTVEIITENRRLLVRLFEKLTGIFERKLPIENMEKQ